MATTRRLTLIAQDPSVLDADGGILRATVDIPYEQLGPGPRGARVHVVDYDASQRVLYAPYTPGDDGDPYLQATDATLLGDPGFHAQNVYAIVMRLLGRFEMALGRRVSWGFGGHQLHVAPHAFAEPNAYYSEDAHGLFFGYFAGADGKPVFTCLSHDVVAHETTHALLDGLRNTYTVPSHPDQAGLHEGFSDTVALLSVFGLPDIVRQLLRGLGPSDGRLDVAKLTAASLRKTVLFGLAEQFGKEASRHRDDALRRAVARPPRPGAQREPAFEECHLRGEILSAAVLNSFIQIWTARLATWLPKHGRLVLAGRVVEDAVDAADHLLTMCIRSLDYCPVVDITFGDFLSAMLTADFELVPNDTKYEYRKRLRKQFDTWGIAPASPTVNGCWEPPDVDGPIRYEGVHRESLERDRDEVFRFLWANRDPLKVYEDAYTRVISVRPCVRVGPDGFVLRETVSEYHQVMEVDARHLPGVAGGMTKPAGMPDDTPIRLHGGGVLTFDEFGHLKYHVRSRIDNAERQNERLAYLWRHRIHDAGGRYGSTYGVPRGQQFAVMHARRDGKKDIPDEWPDATEGGR